MCIYLLHGAADQRWWGEEKQEILKKLKSCLIFVQLLKICFKKIENSLKITSKVLVQRDILNVGDEGIYKSIYDFFTNLTFSENPVSLTSQRILFHVDIRKIDADIEYFSVFLLHKV